MSKARDLAEARAENAEERASVCKTCDTRILPGQEHCPACRQYWQDVADGVFDDQDYGQKWAEALDEF